MSQELDPPMPRDVVTAVKMFGAMILLWAVGSITVHTMLWYHVLPDLRADPRACGPAPGGPTEQVQKERERAAMEQTKPSATGNPTH